MTTVRKFSPAGPCLTQGELVRETTKFLVIRDRYTGKVRRMAKDRVHTEPCHSCTDHPQTSYPYGYMD